VGFLTAEPRGVYGCDCFDVAEGDTEFSTRSCCPARQRFCPWGEFFPTPMRCQNDLSRQKFRAFSRIHQKRKIENACPRTRFFKLKKSSNNSANRELN
jgi:hypothetical protein